MKFSDFWNDWVAAIAAGLVAAILIDDLVIRVAALWLEDPATRPSILLAPWNGLLRVAAFAATLFLFRRLFDR